MPYVGIIIFDGRPLGRHLSSLVYMSSPELDIICTFNLPSMYIVHRGRDMAKYVRENTRAAIIMHMRMHTWPTHTEPTLLPRRQRAVVSKRRILRTGSPGSR
jgi:hypothetical protein